MTTHIYNVCRAAAATLLLTAAVAACTDNRNPLQPDETPQEGRFLSVTATQGGGADTRVTHTPNASGGMDVKWAANDKIYVGKISDINSFLEDGLSPLTITQAGAGQTTARFEGQIAAGDLPANGETLHAVYGNAERIQVRNGKFYYYYYLQRQTANGDMEHLADYDYMSATTIYNPNAGTHHFDFHHAASMMKFTLDGLRGQTVNKLTLCTTDGTSVFPHSDVWVEDISLDLGADSDQGINIANGGKLEAYLMIGATKKTAGKGLILYVTTTNNQYYAATLKGDEIVAGKIYTLTATLTKYGSETFQGQGTTGNPYKIATPEDLTKLSLMTNMGFMNTDGLYFQLTSDIDMKDQEAWVPIGGSGTDREFRGTFTGKKDNGGNYSITNLPAKIKDKRAGLFGELLGAAIKNVTVSGTLNVTMEEEGEGISAGGIAGNAFKSTIEDCVSKCIIQTTAYNESAGGIVGSCAYGITITNCKNEGAVTSKEAGGIIGSVTGKGTITGCSNIGNITSKNEYNPASGIIGILNLAADESFSLTNCSHTGSSPARGSAGCIIGSYSIDPGNPEGTITISNSEGSTAEPIKGRKSGDTVYGQWPKAN